MESIHHRESEAAQDACRPASATSASERRAALYAVLAGIPQGYLLSYGQLAELAGLGRAARWVGRELALLPDDSQLPWHRVVAAGGRLSLPADSLAGQAQRARLAAEGVPVLGARVDLRRYGWHAQPPRG